MSDELGDILWYVANLAEKLGIGLDAIAEANLHKVRGRWPTAGDTLPLLLPDDDFPVSEQLPRSTSVTFVEEPLDGRIRVRLYGPDGEALGDPLTDNAYDDDGYRFHDVFHLAYAAMLGWSPITRFFFGVKRSSSQQVREVEDGGRATVIEEAISAFVFDYARNERFLEGVKHIDFSLLTTIRRLVSRLEVADRTAHDWERTILRSYEVWRPLHAFRGGTVHLDLLSRTVEFEPPRRTPGQTK
jgi:hypothetical protein